MIKDYKEKLLKNLGIYELRELARNVGVVSPTTKKRKQLEQEIIKISKGELAPVANTNKKGRPPKSIKKIEGVVDVFIPKEMWEVSLNKKLEGHFENVLSFNSSEATDNTDYLIEGFLRKTVSGHFYLRNKSNLKEFVSIPFNHVAEYALQEGDKLSVFVKRIVGENQLLFTKIETVNKQEPSFEARQLEDIDSIVFGKTSLKGFEGVFEGENVLLVTENIKSDVAVIKQAIKPLTEEYTVVVLASGISTYTKLLLEKEFNSELIYTVVEDHPAFTYENAMSALAYVDLQIRQGNKIAFVVLDVMTLAKQIEEFLILEHQKQTAEEYIEAIRIAKRFFDYGKVLKNSGSVTVFTHCLKDEIEQDLFKKEFSKLPDKVFYL